jgi:hypothetical protein
MNTTAFLHGGHGFDVLDLSAKLAFKSETSIAFSIGRPCVTRSGPVGSVCVGWIDVHHPCDGHIKAQLRVRVPAEYHDFDKKKIVIHTVFEALSIPLDETYLATFFSSDNVQCIEQRTNRDGVWDAIA